MPAAIPESAANVPRVRYNSAAMRNRAPLLCLRLLALVALAVSCALLLEYVRPVAAFCMPDSGCDKVRQSGYGFILGIPVPVMGMLGFTALFGLSFFARTFALARLGALAGGAGGFVFLALQAFVIHEFCKLCLIVDSASIGAALCALFAPSPVAERPSGRTLAVWACGAILSVLFPIAVLKPPPTIPPAIAPLWVPGKINVVEFSDFECPFCRKLHPDLVELVSKYKDRVHFVRLNMPLTRLHPHARDAARAYSCADEQQKGEPMAEALFRSSDLSPQGCERLAESAGMSMAEYRACLARPATDQRIDDEMRRVQAAGLKGLPTVWIGSQVFVGWQPGQAEELGRAFVAAAEGSRSLRVPIELVWTTFLVMLGAIGAIAVRLEAKSQSPQG